MANSSTIVSAQEQQQLVAFNGTLRALTATKAKYIQAANALVAFFNSTNGVASIFPLLQGTDIVDDNTGLSGANPMSKNDISVLFTDLNTDINAWPLAANLSKWTQAAGPLNVLP
jgi:hypothetical protein